MLLVKVQLEVSWMLLVKVQLEVSLMLLVGVGMWMQLEVSLVTSEVFSQFAVELRMLLEASSIQ